MFLQANYEDLSGQVVAEGEYEVVIKVATQDAAAKSGTEFLNIQMQIRSDIEQPHKNQMIFYSIWHLKNPAPSDPGGFSGRNIQQMSKAVLIPTGAQIATLDDWLKLITGRPVRVKVKHEMYQEQKQVRVAWVNESKQPNVKANPTPSDAVYEQIDDSDVPF